QIFDRHCFNFWRHERSATATDSEAALVCELANLKPGDRVLDLGAGTGRLSRALARRELRVVGVDRSEAAVEEANREKHSLCEFRLCDWTSENFEGHFNCVLFW